MNQYAGMPTKEFNSLYRKLNGNDRKRKIERLARREKAKMFREIIKQGNKP